MRALSGSACGALIVAISLTLSSVLFTVGCASSRDEFNSVPIVIPTVVSSYSLDANGQFGTPESIEKSKYLLPISTSTYRTDEHRTCAGVETAIREQRSITVEEHDRCKDECNEVRGRNAKHIVNIRNIVSKCSKVVSMYPTGEDAHYRIEEDPSGRLNLIGPDPHIVRITTPNDPSGSAERKCIHDSSSLEYPETEIQDVRHNWMYRMPDDANIIYCIQMYDGNNR